MYLSQIRPKPPAPPGHHLAGKRSNRATACIMTSKGHWSLCNSVHEAMMRFKLLATDKARLHSFSHKHTHTLTRGPKGGVICKRI